MNKLAFLFLHFTAIIMALTLLDTPQRNVMIVCAIGNAYFFCIDLYDVINDK